eukprot:Hpha_TRINITY_DN4107_c0_g1::TRINITY_DN4107_c0_g1_i1::g.194837::m.194837
MGNRAACPAASSRLDGLVVWRVREAEGGVILDATDPLGRDETGTGVEVTLFPEDIEQRISPRARSSTAAELLGVMAHLSAAAPSQETDKLPDSKKPSRTKGVSALFWDPRPAAQALAPLVPFSITHSATQPSPTSPQNGRPVDAAFVAAPLALHNTAPAALTAVEAPERCDNRAVALSEIAGAIRSGQKVPSPAEKARLSAGDGLAVQLPVGVVVSLSCSTKVCVGLRPFRPQPVPTPTDGDAASRWPIAGASIPRVALGRPAMYLVAVCPYGGGNEWAVQRRYRAFVSLRSRVHEAGGVSGEPPFPPKTWRKPEGLEDGRRKMLQKWLRHLVAVCQGNDCVLVSGGVRAAVLNFLGAEGACSLPPVGVKAGLLKLRRQSPGAKVGINYSVQGVVTQVMPGGPAAVAGVEPGMRLLSVAGVSVCNDSQVRDAFNQADRDFVITVTMPAQPTSSGPRGVRVHGSGKRGSGGLRRSASPGSQGSSFSSKRVSFSGDPPVTFVEKAAADSWEPSTGQAVVLTGLRELADLNGKRGVVVARIADRFKWHVRLQATGEEVLINLTNMKPIEEPLRRSRGRAGSGGANQPPAAATNVIEGVSDTAVIGADTVREQVSSVGETENPKITDSSPASPAASPESGKSADVVEGGEDRTDSIPAAA